jgi:hypothetical protein
MDAWTGGAQWLADCSGFYFTALVGSETESINASSITTSLTGWLARSNCQPLMSVGTTALPGVDQRTLGRHDQWSHDASSRRRSRSSIG